MNKKIYNLEIKFDDILECCSPDFQEAYNKLTAAQRIKFQMEHVRTLQSGAEHGLCDAVYDVMTILANDLEEKLI